jgi:hypothetical protein
LTGYLADNQDSIAPSTWQKVAAIINDIVSKLTNGAIKPFQDLKNAKEIIEFFDNISNAIREGEVIDETNTLNGGGEIGTFNFTSKSQIKAPKASEDSRDFIRDLVEDLDIREFNGQKFVTNMYDYTTAGVADLGNGFKIDMLGGKNYVPYMMSKKNKKIGDVSNLAAFNTKSQAESFVRNAKQGKAELFAPHSGTLSASWQFQQHTFAELVNLLLDQGIMKNAELINVFNNTIASSVANQKAFEAFNAKYKEKNLRNFNSFKSDPKEIVRLLDIDNNYSPDLRKALNNAISADKTFQKAIGVKNKEQFFNKIMDPLNQGAIGGELINVVKFDPNTFEIVKTEPDGIDHHPSFGWTLLAKIDGIYQPTEFHKSSEVTNSYTKYNLGGKSVSRKATESNYEKTNVSSSAGAIPKIAKFESKSQVSSESEEKFTIDGVEYTQEEVIEKARNTQPFGSKMEYQGDSEQAKRFVADYNRATNPYNKNGELKGKYIKEQMIKALNEMSFKKFGDLYRKHFDSTFTRENNLKSTGGNVGRNFTFRDQAAYIVGDSSYGYSDSEANFRAFANDAEIEIPTNVSPEFTSKSQIDIKQRVDKASEKLKEIFQRDNIPLTIAEAKAIVEEVSDWTSWYDDISTYVNEIFGEYSEDVMSMLPFASMAANSSATVGLAINNAERIYRGEVPVGMAEYYKYVSKFLEGKGIESDKMDSFLKALMGDKDAIAVDMHVWSIIMGKNPGKKQVNPKNEKEFERAKEFVRAIASELGLTPREVQAALWAANIMRTGGRPDSYEEYFKKQVDEKGLKERIENWRNEGYKPFSQIRKEAGTSAQKEVTVKSKSQVDAYHGSPYDFNKFTTEAIGTGEGAQAFGWGLYFTDVESIAMDYAEKLSNKPDAVKEVLFNHLKNESRKDKVLKDLNDTKDILFDLKDYNAVNNVEAAIDLVKSIKRDNVYDFDFENKGTLYNVSLHEGKTPIASDKYQVLGNLVIPKKDPNMSQEEYSGKARRGEIKPLMQFKTNNEAKKWLKNEDTKAEYTWLQWDKPVSKSIKNKIINKFVEKENISNKKIEELKKEGIQYADYETSIDIFEELGIPILEGLTIQLLLDDAETGLRIYDNLKNYFKSDKKASLFLLDAGIDGIKYPSESIVNSAASVKSRGSNYVVFDENAVTVRSKSQAEELPVEGFKASEEAKKAAEIAIKMETAMAKAPSLKEKQTAKLSEEIEALKSENPEKAEVIDTIANNIDAIRAQLLEAGIIESINCKWG